MQAVSVKATRTCAVHSVARRWTVQKGGQQQLTDGELGDDEHALVDLVLAIDLLHADAELHALALALCEAALHILVLGQAQVVVRLVVCAWRL
jgi:hypothetical protein